MRFAPEYIKYVLNENFEDAKRQFVAPLMAIHYAHLAMLADRTIVGPADSRRIREALDAIATDDITHVTYDGTYEDLFFYIERLLTDGLRRRGRRPAAHGPQPQRHRHDDVPDAPAGVHPGAVRRRARPARQPAGPCSQAPRNRDGGAHAHPAGAADDRGALPAGRHRAARTRRRAAAGVVSDDEPQSAGRVRDHGYRVRDRSASHERPAWLRRPDRQHLRQHRDGGLPARERLGHGGAADWPGPLRPGPAAVGDGRVRVRPLRRRLRAVEQHHAAEAQPGGNRARARHRQQGARPDTGHRHDRPQHAVWRRRRHRGRPAAACGIDVPRCRARREAGGRGDADRRVRRRCGSKRAPARAGRR